MPGESTTSVDAAGSLASVIEDEEPPEPLPPPGPARASLTPEALEPWAPDSEQGRSAAAVHRALQHVESGEHEAALAALDDVAPSWPVPDLVAWLRARSLEALDRPGELGAVLATIPADSRFHARAELLGAKLALEAEEPEALLTLLGEHDADKYSALDARADVLRAQAYALRGAEGDAAASINAARRAWTGAPRTQAGADADTFLDANESGVPIELRRSLVDEVARAVSLGRRHANKDIVALLDGKRTALADLADTDADAACAGLFQLGRAWHKRREYGNSVPVLKTADKLCPPGDDKVKTVYLLA